MFREVKSILVMVIWFFKINKEVILFFNISV